MAHPLLAAMYEMYKASPEGLKDLFARKRLKHVATYVVVQSTASLLCNVRTKTKRNPAQRTCFGGCD
jgi:hypothetical protein